MNPSLKSLGPVQLPLSSVRITVLKVENICETAL